MTTFAFAGAVPGPEFQRGRDGCTRRSVRPSGRPGDATAHPRRAPLVGAVFAVQRRELLSSFFAGSDFLRTEGPDVGFPGSGGRGWPRLPGKPERCGGSQPITAPGT